MSARGPLAALLLLAGGCLTRVPHSRTRSLGRITTPPVVDAVHGLELDTRVEGTAAIVTARWRRDCRHDVLESIETTEWESVRLAGTRDGDVWGYAAAVGLAVVWPVGLVVGAGSVIGLAARPPRGETSTVDRRWVGERRFPCALRGANLAVELRLPSGATIAGVTDRSGTAVFLLPPGESGAPVAALAARAVLPPRTALEKAPPGGADVSSSAPLEALRRTADSRARRGDCATVAIIAARVQGMNKPYFARRFRPTPAIQRCLP
jgi:hypothetical protein